ncbi:MULTISPECIES: hypothetical protein [Frankia]|nr:MULTISPECIES: hypothetical protein [Frankia]
MSHPGNAASMSEGAMSAGRDLLPGGPAMAVAHLLAALVLAWWLAAGERLLWTVVRRTAAVARRLARCLRRRGSARGPITITGVQPTFRRGCNRLPSLLRHVVVHRGPPVGAPA